MGFQYLIRFRDNDDVIQYGNLSSPPDLDTIEGTTVQLVSGDLHSGFKVGKSKAVVKKLLCPLPSTPLVTCAGVNYHSHIEETKLEDIPEQPIIFASNPDRLAGPKDDIPIPPSAQHMLDYEGELAVVIGRDGKDIPEDEALDYVLGYAAGNDISLRSTMPMMMMAFSVSYLKSFDQFGPIGPAIASTSVISDPQQLPFVTRVNGEVKQDSNTSDMLFSVKQIIAYASRGHTIHRGTVLLTGTPAGVGWTTNGLLRDGDVVEVDFGRLGKISNRMVFQK